MLTYTHLKPETMIMNQTCLTEAFFKTSKSFQKDALDANRTIIARWPTLMTELMTHGDPLDEWRRAYHEKLAAMSEGMFAAGLAWHMSLLRINWMTPASHHAVQTFSDMAEAAARPARRRMKANQARLKKRH